MRSNDTPSLFPDQDLGYRYRSRRAPSRRRRSRSAPRQEKLVTDRHMIEDTEGHMLYATVDIMSRHWHLAWEHDPGSALTSPESLHNKTFKDLDGVFYFHGPLWMGRRNRAVDTETLLKLKLLIDPDSEYTYGVADDELLELLKFSNTLFSYRSALSQYKNTRAKYKHPDKSVTVEMRKHHLDWSRRAFDKFGFTPNDIDLAVSMYETGITHPREIMQAVLTMH